MIIPTQPAIPRTRELNSDGGHWYTTSGHPCHTVPNLSKGGERNTTVKDARKLGLYPSVTSISKVIANPAVERWKQAEILKSVIANPRGEREDEEFYKSRIRKLAQTKMVDARAFGSQVHEAIDELNKTGFCCDRHSEVKDWIMEYVWWKEESELRFLKTEFTAINPRLGYAGQVDGLGVIRGKTNILLDYKTQSYDPDKGPSYYESWPIQLAAYLNADWEGKPSKIHQVWSVVICSQKPVPPVVRVWTKAELASAWKQFKAANVLWQIANNYNPAKTIKELHGQNEQG